VVDSFCLYARLVVDYIPTTAEDLVQLRVRTK